MGDETMQDEMYDLFVTGISGRLKEPELKEMFSAYGKVEKCQIVIDPHTKESRGFGFVQMSTVEEANAAREGLTGENRYGKMLSVDRAYRNRPRTPTPGVYFGPPKKGSLSEKKDNIQERRRTSSPLYHRNRYGRYSYDRGTYDDRSYSYYDERGSRIDRDRRHDRRYGKPYDDGYERGYRRRKYEYYGGYKNIH